MTHYVPYFTVEARRGQFKTVCGVWVGMDQHRVEPDCPDCKAYLEQDAADLDALQAWSADQDRRAR